MLAALSVAPSTGYAVREQIRDQLGMFWSESFGQIYPALGRLRAQALVRTTDGDRPGSSVFELTPEGRTRLVELLREPASTLPPRNGLLLRLFFGNELGASACRELVVEARARAVDQLTRLSVARREAEAEPLTTPQRPYWLITVAAGEHAARAAIAWADETIGVLDQLPSVERQPEQADPAAVVMAGRSR